MESSPSNRMVEDDLSTLPPSGPPSLILEGSPSSPPPSLEPIYPDESGSSGRMMDNGSSQLMMKEVSGGGENEKPPDLSPNDPPVINWDISFPHTMTNPNVYRDEGKNGMEDGEEEAGNCRAGSSNFKSSVKDFIKMTRERRRDRAASLDGLSECSDPESIFFPDSRKPEIEIVEGIAFLCWETQEDCLEYAKKDRLKTLSLTPQPYSAKKRLILGPRLKRGPKPGFKRKPRPMSPAGPPVLMKEDGSALTPFSSSSRYFDDYLRFGQVNSIHKMHSLSPTDLPPILTKEPSSKEGNYLLHSSFDPSTSSMALEERKAKRAYRKNLSKLISSVYRRTGLNQKGSPDKLRVHRGPGRPRKKENMPYFKCFQGFPEDNFTIIRDEVSGEGKVELEDLLLQYNGREMYKKPASCHPSFTMDESYVRYALGALLLDEAPTPPFPSHIKTPCLLESLCLEPKKVKEVKSPKEKKGDEMAGDITKIISRHSKRDIRLPARYHQSGLLMGSQWVIPDLNSSSEKTGRRRLVEEQKRLINQQKIMNSFYSFKEERDEDCMEKLSALHREEFGETKKSIKKPITKQKIMQMQRKQELMERRKALEEAEFSEGELRKMKLKKKSQRVGSSILKSDEEKVGEEVDEDDDEDEDEDKYAPDCSTNKLISQLEETSVILDKESRLDDSKESKKAELRELYRVLYFENHPERKVTYNKTRIKPRVNKKDVVEEGIQIIERLSKRSKQLEYIKKLLTLWNNKLEICMKVAEKNDKAAQPQALRVVEEVLKTYRSSKCYKLTEAIESRKRQFSGTTIATKRPPTTAKSKEEKTEVKKTANQANMRILPKRVTDLQKGITRAKGISGKHGKFFISALNKTQLNQPASIGNRIRVIEASSSSSTSSSSSSTTSPAIIKAANVKPTFIKINNNNNQNSSSSLPKGIPINNGTIGGVVPIGRSNTSVGINRPSPVVSSSASTIPPANITTNYRLMVQGPAMDKNYHPVKTEFKPTILKAGQLQRNMPDVRPTSLISVTKSTKPLITPLTTPGLLKSNLVKTQAVTNQIKKGVPKKFIKVNVPASTKMSTGEKECSDKGNAMGSASTSNGSNSSKMNGSSSSSSSGTSNGSSNMLVTYCLKDNKLVPLVPIKSSVASGLPVYKLSQIPGKFVNVKCVNSEDGNSSN